MEQNLGEDFKVKALSAAHNTLGFRKRKCQDWFAENYEEIDALLETKRNLFRKTLSKICPTKQKWKLQKHTSIFKEWHIRVYAIYQTSGRSRRQKKHNLQQTAKTRYCSTK